MVTPTANPSLKRGFDAFASDSGTGSAAIASDSGAGSAIAAIDLASAIEIDTSRSHTDLPPSKRRAMDVNPILGEKVPVQVESAAAAGAEEDTVQVEPAVIGAENNLEENPDLVDAAAAVVASDEEPAPLSTATKAKKKEKCAYCQINHNKCESYCPFRSFLKNNFTNQMAVKKVKQYITPLTLLNRFEKLRDEDPDEEKRKTLFNSFHRFFNETESNPGGPYALFIDLQERVDKVRTMLQAGIEKSERAEPFGVEEMETLLHNCLDELDRSIGDV